MSTLRRSSSRTRTPTTVASGANNNATAAAAASSSAAPVASAAAVATSASHSNKRPVVALQEVTDAEDPTVRYQLLARVRASQYSLTVLCAPRESADPATTSSSRHHNGWLKSFNGPLVDTLQPASLPESYRVGWSNRVWQGLSGLPNTDERFAISIKEVAADRSLDASQRRSELKLVYKTHTLVRLLLLPPEPATSSSSSSIDSMKLFRDASLHLVKQVLDLTNAGQTRIKERSEVVKENEVQFAARLQTLRDRALRKTYADEAMFSWFQHILSAKDREMDRITAERHRLEAELRELQTRKHMASASDSLGLVMPSQLSEDDLRAMMNPVDDEEVEMTGDSDRSDQEEEEDDISPKPRGRKTSPAAAASPKAKAVRKPRAPAKPKAAVAAAASSAASSSSKARPRAKAHVIASDSEPDASGASSTKKKVTKIVKKPKTKKEDLEMEEEKSREKPKQTRKRPRSPSPIAEEAEIIDVEDDTADAAIAAVAAYEASVASRRAPASAATAAAPSSPSLHPELEIPTHPLPARHTRSNTNSSAPPTTSHSITATAAAPHRPPTPHQRDDTAHHVDSSLDSSASQHAAKKRRRNVSPPPQRVLPKRSLAEILRAGAAGIDSSEVQDEEDQQEADENVEALPLLPMRAPSSRTQRASLQPMDIDSQ